MKRIKRLFFISLIFSLLFTSLFSYSDYYKKLYVIKINKTELYNHIGATDKQIKSLEKIFDKYQRKSKEIADKPLLYEKKSESIRELKKDEENSILKVLDQNQRKLFKDYVKQKKLEFIERNENISEAVKSLNLTNKQESDILKYQRDFKRNLEYILEEDISQEDFLGQYDELKQKRNSLIRDALTEDQLRVVQEKLLFID